MTDPAETKTASAYDADRFPGRGEAATIPHEDVLRILRATRPVHAFTGERAGGLLMATAIIVEALR